MYVGRLRAERRANSFVVKASLILILLPMPREALCAMPDSIYPVRQTLQIRCLIWLKNVPTLRALAEMFSISGALSTAHFPLRRAVLQAVVSHYGLPRSHLPQQTANTHQRRVDALMEARTACKPGALSSAVGFQRGRRRKIPFPTPISETGSMTG